MWKIRDSGKIYLYYKSVFHVSCCFSSILELLVRGESNEFHKFYFLQQHNISLTVHVHPA